jgi:hypothetical protein
MEPGYGTDPEGDRQPAPMVSWQSPANAQSASVSAASPSALLRTSVRPISGYGVFFTVNPSFYSAGLIQVIDAVAVQHGEYVGATCEGGFRSTV